MVASAGLFYADRSWHGRGNARENLDRLDANNLKSYESDLAGGSVPNPESAGGTGFGPAKWSFLQIRGFARDLKLNAAGWHERAKVPNPEARAGLERRSVKSSGCRSGSCNPSESGSGSVYGDPSGLASPWTIDLMGVGSGEWQLASSLVTLATGQRRVATCIGLDQPNKRWQQRVASRIELAQPNRRWRTK